MTTQTTFVVVDANVVVYALIGDSRRAIFDPYLAGATVLMSFQTAAELRLIALRRNWGSTKLDGLDRALRAMVIVPATEAITSQCAQIMYQQLSAGSRIEWPDAWVAATAITYGCPVVTNDRGDFQRIPGIALLPP